MKIILALLFLTTNVFADIPVKPIQYDYALSVDGLLISLKSQTSPPNLVLNKYNNKKILISGMSGSLLACTNKEVKGKSLYFLFMRTFEWYKNHWREYLQTGEHNDLQAWDPNDTILIQLSLNKQEAFELYNKYDQKIVVLCTAYVEKEKIILFANCSVIK